MNAFKSDTKPNDEQQQHSQDVYYHDSWHNLYIVFILITIEHLTQFLRIFYVPR